MQSARAGFKFRGDIISQEAGHALWRDQQVHVLCRSRMLMCIDGHAADQGVINSSFFQLQSNPAHRLMNSIGRIEEHGDILEPFAK